MQISNDARRVGGCQSGFTLFEMTLTLGVFTIIFSSLFLVVSGVQSSYDQGSTRAVLQESGRRIMKQLIQELRQTGITQHNGVNLPAIYERRVRPMGEGNERDDLIATMSFLDANLGGQISEGEDRVITHLDRVANEIVFQRLADLDGNGYPIDEATGDLEWGDEEFSMYVVLDASGTPQLIRESDGGDFRVIGRDVEKVVFDVISYDPTVLYNQVVIVLYMGTRISNGEIVRVGLESTVNLRNSRELED